MNDRISEIIGVLREKDSFLVLGHIGCDGDSIGSSLALTLYLKEQAGKKAFMPSPVNWPGRYSFLEKHRNGTGETPKIPVESIVMLDSSSPDRVDWGSLNPLDYKDTKKIIIDHHDEGIPFGDINWIDTNSAAVGEMVFEILSAMNAEITPAIAESLYLAIVMDTGRFAFSNTTARSLEICSQLVRTGNVSPSIIANHVYFNYSEEYLRNIGIALYNSRTYRDGKIVLLTLDKASVRSFSTTFDETEGIVDLAMSMHGVRLSALFKEVDKNNIRISMRSKGIVDVGALATELGGGGHRNAAGCTLKMPLSLAREVILDRFEAFLMSKA